MSDVIVAWGVPLGLFPDGRPERQYDYHRVIAIEQLKDKGVTHAIFEYPGFHEYRGALGDPIMEFGLSIARRIGLGLIMSPRLWKTWRFKERSHTIADPDVCSLKDPLHYVVAIAHATAHAEEVGGLSGLHTEPLAGEGSVSIVQRERLEELSVDRGNPGADNEILRIIAAQDVAVASVGQVDIASPVICTGTYYTQWFASLGKRLGSCAGLTYDAEPDADLGVPHLDMWSCSMDADTIPRAKRVIAAAPELHERYGVSVIRLHPKNYDAAVAVPGLW